MIDQINAITALQAIEWKAIYKNDELSPFINDVSRDHFGEIYFTCQWLFDKADNKLLHNYVYIPKFNHNFVLNVETLAKLPGCFGILITGSRCIHKDKHTCICVYFLIMQSNYWYEFFFMRSSYFCVFPFLLTILVSVSISVW